MRYFPIEKAVYHHQLEDKKVLEVLANRFMADNPSYNYLLCLDSNQNEVDKKGQVHLNYEALFPNSGIGTVAQSRGIICLNHSKSTSFKIRCYGPTKVFVNGLLVFESTPAQENFRRDHVFQFELQDNENHILIESEKTTLGFGVVIGNNMPQWESTHFFSSEGVAGLESCLKGESCKMPEIAEEFEEGIYVFKSYVLCDIPNELRIDHLSEEIFEVYIGNEKVEMANQISVPSGETPIYLVYSGRQPLQAISTISLSYDGEKMRISSKVKGNSEVWIYSGVYSAPIDLSKFNEMHRILPNGGYWKGLNNYVVRPFQPATLFGFWSYPMGVTLYGLLLAGRYFKEKRWTSYAIQSLDMICKWDEYTLYDKQIYGYPGINTQLHWLDDLDDCGSFGSFMLEAQKEVANPAIGSIAKRIANFMIEQQKREADGAYSRHDHTMWIDDLYMSVPFLVRYYEQTKEEKYLNEAINQLLLFKKRFFMPEKKLMSHIYDPIMEQGNKIPWSRGNGWVIFSLSELLKFVPESHEGKSELLVFFNEMIEGILKTQGESGVWHQVLDEPNTYLESSSTSMFICALSRGIRLKYLEDRLLGEAQAAVFKAWKGLQKIAIDSDGNLYGVCRGSGFSFSRSYYRELTWNKNDPHGVGITILAGVEKMMLVEYLNDMNPHLEEENLIEAVEQVFAVDKSLAKMATDTRLKEVRMSRSDPIEKAIHYIEDNFKQSPTLREVAKHVHLNPSYFSVLFREQTSLTFSEYMIRKKIQEAKKLLLMTTLSIDEVTEAVGYQSSKYFIKLFKNYEGVTPGKYRKQINTDSR